LTKTANSACPEEEEEEEDLVAFCSGVQKGIQVNLHMVLCPFA
jgi:hypothetical protein